MLYDVCTPTRYAVDSSMHGSSKEHTIMKKTRR